MEILVVDDEQAVQDQLRDYLSRYREENGLDLSLRCFSSGDALLKAYRKDADLIFFDIDMPGTNGLDAARRVRAADRDVAIVFVTNMAQYAINGYEVDAVDYILKPLNYYDFAVKFGKALRRIRRDRRQMITLETEGGLAAVDLRKVRYLEILGHYLIWHTEDRDIRTRGNMNRQTETLREYGFARIHKSYMINLAHLQELRPAEVVLPGIRLPVGRVYKAGLMQEYLNYLGG